MPEAPCHTKTDNAPHEPARCTTNTHFDLCPPSRCLCKLNEPKVSRRFTRAGDAVSHHDGQRAARTKTLHDQHTLRPMPPSRCL